MGGAQPAPVCPFNGEYVVKAAAAALSVALVVGAGACSSSTREGVSSPGTTVRPGATMITVPETTTTVAVTPTAFNCGGGAYEPSTLIVVCGINTTTVTGAKWSSWTSEQATGTGTVNLGAGHPGGDPASLVLSDVVTTSGGPQFSTLVVTWTGTSPDGQPTQTFHLPTAGS